MKKLIWFIGFVLIGINLATAQNVSDANAPKISVGEFKWFKQALTRRLGNSNPFPADSSKNERVIEPGKFPSNEANKEYFVYEADFKNETGRKIKGLVWEYIFLNADGTKELKRHEFFYPFKIAINKRVTARDKNTASPTNIVSADDLEKAESARYVERVEIKCVIFDDNSIWKKLETKDEICQKLDFFIRSLK